MTDDKPMWIKESEIRLEHIRKCVCGVDYVWPNYTGGIHCMAGQNAKALQFRLAEAEDLLKECDSIIKVSKHYIEDGAEIELQNAAKVLEKLKAFREDKP